MTSTRVKKRARQIQRQDDVKYMVALRRAEAEADQAALDELDRPLTNIEEEHHGRTSER